MKINRILSFALAVAVLTGTMSSCDKDDENDPKVNSIIVDSDEFSASQAGYSNSGEPNSWTTVQFVYDDASAASSWPNIEIVIPDTELGGWYTLAEDASGWSVLLDHVYVGNSQNMGVISSGRVYVQKLGEPYSSNNLTYCRYEVKMELTLTTGKTASMHYEGTLSRGALWFAD